MSQRPLTSPDTVWCSEVVFDGRHARPIVRLALLLSAMSTAVYFLWLFPAETPASVLFLGASCAMAAWAYRLNSIKKEVQSNPMRQVTMSSTCFSIKQFGRVQEFDTNNCGWYIGPTSLDGHSFFLPRGRGPIVQCGERQFIALGLPDDEQESWALAASKAGMQYLGHYSTASKVATYVQSLVLAGVVGALLAVVVVVGALQMGVLSIETKAAMMTGALAGAVVTIVSSNEKRLHGTSLYAKTLILGFVSSTYGWIGARVVQLNPTDTSIVVGWFAVVFSSWFVVVVGRNR